MSKKPIQIAFYEKTEEQRERILNYRKRSIERGDNELLKSMKVIAEASLKKYRGDFYIHDVELVKNNQDAPFLWIVRDNGTHYIHLHSETFSKNNEWYSSIEFFSVLDNYSSRIKGIYFCNDGKLQKVTNISKATLILQEYENFMRKRVAI